MDLYTGVAGTLRFPLPDIDLELAAQEPSKTSKVTGEICCCYTTDTTREIVLRNPSPLLMWYFLFAETVVSHLSILTHQNATDRVHHKGRERREDYDQGEIRGG